MKGAYNPSTWNLHGILAALVSPTSLPASWEEGGPQRTLGTGNFQLRNGTCTENFLWQICRQRVWNVGLASPICSQGNPWAHELQFLSSPRVPWCRCKAREHRDAVGSEHPMQPCGLSCHRRTTRQYQRSGSCTVMVEKQQLQQTPFL